MHSNDLPINRCLSGRSSHSDAGSPTCTRVPAPSSTVRSSSNDASNYDPSAGVSRLGRSGGEGALVQRAGGQVDRRVREMDVRVGGRERLIGKFVGWLRIALRSTCTSTSCPNGAWSTPTTCTGRARRSRCRWPAWSSCVAGKGRDETHRHRAARVSRWLRRRRQPRTRHARAHGQPGSGARRRRLARAAQDASADQGYSEPT